MKRSNEKMRILEGKNETRNYNKKYFRHKKKFPMF